MEHTLSAAPEPAPTYHLSKDEQEAFRRALVKSTEPAPNESTATQPPKFANKGIDKAVAVVRGPYAWMPSALERSADNLDEKQFYDTARLERECATALQSQTSRIAKLEGQLAEARAKHYEECAEICDALFNQNADGSLCARPWVETSYAAAIRAKLTEGGKHE